MSNQKKQKIKKNQLNFYLIFNVFSSHSSSHSILLSLSAQKLCTSAFISRRFFFHLFIIFPSFFTFSQFFLCCLALHLLSLSMFHHQLNWIFIFPLHFIRLRITSRQSCFNYVQCICVMHCFNHTLLCVYFYAVLLCRKIMYTINTGDIPEHYDFTKTLKYGVCDVKTD